MREKDRDIKIRNLPNHPKTSGQKTVEEGEDRKIFFPLSSQWHVHLPEMTIGITYSLIIYYFYIIHWQVTDSLEYYIEVKIARTICKKISEDENCAFQEDPKMQKVCGWDKENPLPW